MVKARNSFIGQDSIGTPDFISAESIAHWAALTFDTSASLTLNCRPLLSSGLFGFEAELSWRLVRTCAKMLDEATQSWLSGSMDMTDERANEIISTATAWKLLNWKLTAVFKESLRDGHNESEVLKAYNAVVDAIKVFDRTFRHRLEACQRRIHFLRQETKLRWCKSSTGPRSESPALSTYRFLDASLSPEHLNAS